MADILIVYGTTEGQARKIARAAADHLTCAKHNAALVDASDPPADLGDKIAAADAVVFASSVHMARHQSSVARVIEAHKPALSGKPCAFISVSLSILSEDADEREEAKAYAADFFKSIDWTPKTVHHAAGALRYVEYDWMKRWILRRIAKSKDLPTDVGKDHEFTDWRALESFVDDFVAAL